MSAILPDETPAPLLSARSCQLLALSDLARRKYNKFQMFDTTWANKSKWRQEGDALSLFIPSPAEMPPVEAVALLHWEEHCLECAVPQCYGECPLFQARPDGRCLRLEYGFVRDARFKGPLGYGIDCRFRRWSKIETKFHRQTLASTWLRHVDRLSRCASAVCRRLSWLMLPLPRRRRLTWLLDHTRNRLLSRLSHRAENNLSAFVIECYSMEAKPFRLCLQCKDNGSILSTHSFDIQPGHNFFQMPFEQFNLRSCAANALISIWPENDLAARVIFTWLDFVRLRKEAEPASKPATRPAAKVKCVAWDLDNTLWDGVLIDKGLSGVRLNLHAVAVIKELDRRGIIHTIVSKNTHEQAWDAIKALGLEEYFIFPAINWGPKSENLRQVASRINIGLDSMAFIDDSHFEREEVASNLPMVRVYPVTQLGQLPQLSEFDVPVTEMSRQRRLSYLAEMKREEFRAVSKGDNLEYLRGCRISVEVFRPASAEEKARCLELLQRSNQLNLSTRRYDEREFSELLANRDFECLGFRCSDRFGDYGIVGFISIRQGDVPRIVDLVISCRVAKRRVEHTLIDWLGRRYRSKGRRLLSATLVRTNRNAVLAEVFRELPFEAASENDSVIEFVMDIAKDRPPEDVVSLKEMQ